MARTRQIKPEFFLDDELATVDRDARLLFIGLWTIADREGRLEDKPAKIKAQVFPYDSDLTYQKIDALLNHLWTLNYIYRYSVENRKYIQIRTFSKHQHCHLRESPSTIPAPTLDGAHQPRPCLAPDLHVPRLPASTSTSTKASTSTTAATQATPPEEKPKDEAYEIFCDEFADKRKIEYREKPGTKADFVQLASLRRQLKIGTRDTPKNWRGAISNYLQTPQGKYSLSDLCVRFDVFLASPLDRYGKPVQSNTDTIGSAPDLPVDEEWRQKALEMQPPDPFGDVA